MLRCPRLGAALTSILALARPEPAPAARSCAADYADLAPSATAPAGKRLERDDPQVRKLVQSLGEPGKPGGVSRTPPRNQRQGDTCWSYTLNGLAESQKLAATNEPTHLAPEYLQFYNIYYQLENRLGYFRAMATRLGETAPGAAKTEREDLKLFYNVAARERRTAAPDAEGRFFLPSMGQFEGNALEMVRDTGLLPVKDLDAPVKTALQEKDLEHSIRNFIGKYMLNGKNLARYERKDADGINSNLFHDLAQYLKPYIGPQPLRPTEEFTYRGKTFTPRTFMTDFMKFDPREFQSLKPATKDPALALKAIATSIDKDRPVPIDIRLYGDKVNEQGLTNFGAGTQSGVFSPKFCPDGKCRKLEGGHELLVVNYLRGKKTHEVTALIVKNSWGEERGLGVDGQLPASKGEEGYYVVTADYLKSGLSDFVLPKDIGDSPDFRGRFEAGPE